MSPSQTDTTIIKDMKTKILAKLNNRYTTDQIKSLKTCTLLDVRYKTCEYVKDDFDQLENEVKEMLGNQEQSQQEIPATQGQELDNLSSIERNARSSNVSIFEFQDDVVDTSSIEQRDTLQYEMRHYKSLTMSATPSNICPI